MTRGDEAIGSSAVRGNALLDALAPDDAAIVAADLRRHVVTGGDTVVDADRALDRLIFPETAVISLSAPAPNGRPMDIGLVGREGMIGWPALMGDEIPSYSASVLLQGGTILSIPAARLRAACNASATLLPGLLRFVGMFVQQMSRTIVSTACDPAERRLARWLLMLHDRIDGDDLAIKHSELGTLLNLRRATITDCLHILEGERALRCTRGRILVRDRAVLEAFAGDAYGRCEANYRTLIGDFGKTATHSPLH